MAHRFDEGFGEMDESSRRRWLEVRVLVQQHGRVIQYDGPKFIADLAYRWNKHGSRQRMRHRMVMDQIPRRMRHGRGTPFVTNPE